ncbi:hypothetical protein [Actinomycetospora sp. NBRC 106378]|uniref:hypothetical protein n=1 Tax=Actinomycetospora sp. NBRC 106378 TaxID=3032208 RepID=UPI0025576637|nr:hypothetical protein [Actinomycetospora sp. NBRC 106378]
MSVPVPLGLYTEPSRGAPAFPPPPPPQASDPTVLSTGQVVPRQAMPTVPAVDSFSVDLAAAPQVLRDLREAAEELTAIRRDAVQLGKVDPGTSDEVSRDAASVLETVAVGGTGSLLSALDGGLRRLEALVHAIETELGEYRLAEESAGRGFDALP